jgi:drug/metabolite transporter (DMT)-like permease
MFFIVNNIFFILFFFINSIPLGSIGAIKQYLFKYVKIITCLFIFIKDDLICNSIQKYGYPYYTWIINGSSFLVIKVAIDTIPPLLSAGLRFLIVGLILFTIFFLRRHHHYEKISREQWKHALVIGAALFFRWSRITYMGNSIP